MLFTIPKAKSFVAAINKFFKLNPDKTEVIALAKADLAQYAQKYLKDLDDLCLLAEIIDEAIPDADEKKINDILALFPAALENIKAASQPIQPAKIHQKIVGLNNQARTIFCGALSLNKEDYLIVVHNFDQHTAEDFYRQISQLTHSNEREELFQNCVALFPELIRDLYDAFCIFVGLTPAECTRVCDAISLSQWKNLIPDAKQFFLLIRYLSIPQRTAIKCALIEKSTDFFPMATDRFFVKKYENSEWRPGVINRDTFSENMWCVEEDEKTALSKLSTSQSPSSQKPPFTPNRFIMYSTLAFLPSRRKLFQDSTEVTPIKIETIKELNDALSAIHHRKDGTRYHKELFTSVNNGNFFKTTSEFVDFLNALKDDSERDVACEVFKHNIIRTISTLSHYQQLFPTPIAASRRVIHEIFENNVALTLASFYILEQQRSTASMWKNAEKEQVDKMHNTTNSGEKIALIMAAIAAHPSGLLSRAWQLVTASDGNIKTLIIAVHLDAFELNFFNRAQFFGQTYYTRAQLEAAYNENALNMYGADDASLDPSRDPLLNAIKSKLLPLQHKPENQASFFKMSAF